MNVYKTKLEGVLIIEPDVFPDERGYFFESFSQKKYNECKLGFNFIQDNISKSKRGTVRGLHYQIGKSAQGKLCQVMQGKVLDVAVDIRFGSPTFGEYLTTILSEENHKQFWIPAGFAHGFSVLSEEAIFLYKCTNYYSKKDERSILFNDPDLNIDWQVDKIEVSEKDLRGVRFKDIGKDFIYK